MPSDDATAAAEMALDVEAVRGVCHTCRILLIEADDLTLEDTASAVNTAVRMGATEVTTTFGAPVAPTSASVLAAYTIRAW